MKARVKPFRIILALLSLLFSVVSVGAVSYSFFFGEMTFLGRKLNLFECVNLILKIIDFNPDNYFYYLSCIVVGVIYLIFCILFVKTLVKTVISSYQLLANLAHADNLYIAHDSLLSYHNDALYQLFSFVLIAALFSRVNVSDVMIYALGFAFTSYAIAMIFDNVFIGAHKFLCLWEIFRIFVMAVLFLFAIDPLNSGALQQLASFGMNVDAIASGTISSREATYIVYQFLVQPIMVAILTVLTICTIYAGLAKYRHYKYEKQSFLRMLKKTAIFTLILLLSSGIIPAYCLNSNANIEFTASFFKQCYDLVKTTYLPFFLLLLANYIVYVSFPELDKYYKKAFRE